MTPVSVRWFYKVEACIILHMSLYMLSHKIAWSQGRPLLPALRNSDRYLTIPLTPTHPDHLHLTPTHPDHLTISTALNPKQGTLWHLSILEKDTSASKTIELKYLFQKIGDRLRPPVDLFINCFGNLICLLWSPLAFQSKVEALTNCLLFSFDLKYFTLGCFGIVLLSSTAPPCTVIGTAPSLITAVYLGTMGSMTFLLKLQILSHSIMTTDLDEPCEKYRTNMITIQYVNQYKGTETSDITFDFKALWYGTVKKN